MRSLTQLVISTLICVTWSSSATAALISLDDSRFGVGSITRDTNTGLDWLDVPLSEGRRFVDVVGQFGLGGDFEGFRHVSVAEWRTFIINAGIPNTDVIVTGDVTAFTNLTSLVRATGFQSVFPETFGFLNDSPYSPLRRSGYLDYFPGDVPPNYIARTVVNLNETVEFRTVGHWLVRRVPTSIPEPSVIAGLGILGLGLLVQKNLSKQ